MRLTEVLLMKRLHIGLSDINNMTPHRIYEYVVILSELDKIEKEKMEAIKNA